MIPIPSGHHNVPLAWAPPHAWAPFWETDVIEIIRREEGSSQNTCRAGSITRKKKVKMQGWAYCDRGLGGRASL